jgi:hypothetical protein
MEMHPAARSGHAAARGAPPQKPFPRKAEPACRDEKRLLKAARNLLLRIGS